MHPPARGESLNYPGIVGFDPVNPTPIKFVAIWQLEATRQALHARGLNMLTRPSATRVEGDVDMPWTCCQHASSTDGKLRHGGQKVEQHRIALYHFIGDL